MQKLKAGPVLWLRAAAASLWLLGALQAGAEQAGAGSEPSAISQLATFTAQGVVKEASGELTSWGMSALGFPSTNGSAELANLLEEVVAELDAIKQEVAGLECIDNATDAQAAAARIQSAWTTYQLSVEASFIDSTALSSWTSYVRGVGSDSLTADLQLISDDFTGQGSGQSILASCETASGVTPPQKDTLDDRDAWAFTTNLTNYYADTAIVGVAMLADDFHLQAYQAWLGEGNTPSDTTTDDLPVTVCGDPPPNTPRAGACASAADYYTTYRQNVVAILDYGGAPYSTDDQWLLNGRGSLWVVNYNDFMLAGGYSSSCVATNSATTPCGAGVGAATLSRFYKLDSTSDEVSYGDYVVAWTPADATAWSSLLKNWSSDHLVDYLGGTAPGVTPAVPGLGLDRSSLVNRFFYTGDTLSADFEVTVPFLNGNAHFHTLEVACFVSPESPYDSLVQPICNENSLVGMESIDVNHTDGNDKHTCATFEITQTLINDKESETKVDALISNFVGGRYQMTQQCDSGSHVRGWENPISNQPPGQPPGWLLDYRVNLTNTDGWGPYDSGAVESPVNAQYHYPAIVLDDYYQQYDSATACSSETTNRGGTGVLPSLCGSLLDSYVDAIIPPVPTGAVPDLSVPDETWVVRVDQREVPDGTHLEVRQPVDYADQVSAVDPDRGSLMPDCFPSSGTALGLGITRVQCVATDLDGDSVQGDFDVHVQYPFRFVGRFSGRRGMVLLKSGRNTKIEFSMDGYKGLDVFAATPTSTRIHCKTGEVKGKPKEISSGHKSHWHRKDKSHKSHKRNTSAGLTYHPRHDEYGQSWKTDRRWKHQCRRISLPLVDGTTQTTDVRFH